MIQLVLARIYNTKSESNNMPLLHWFLSEDYYGDGTMFSLCQRVSHAVEEVAGGRECEVYISDGWDEYVCKWCKKAERKLEILEELGE